MSIGAIILAAGGSSRLGLPKQFLRIGGETLLRSTARAVLGSRCDPVIVVAGDQRGACEEELTDLSVGIVPNPDWREGISTSIRSGISFLARVHQQCQGVVIAVCDQPYLTGEIIDALLDEHRVSGRGLVASQYAGTLGVPAFFHASYFDELLALRGDQGARTLFARFASDCAEVPFPLGAVDIDTLSDYENISPRQNWNMVSTGGVAALHARQTEEVRAPAIVQSLGLLRGLLG